MDLDRLALCSKIMFDNRILQQREEIELLRLRIFWLENGYEAMKIAMYNFNNMVVEMCECFWCCCADRLDREDYEHIEMDHFNCRFKTAFENLMTKYGLTWTNDPGNNLVIDVVNDRWPVHSKCTDVNAHFQNSGHEHWTSWKFGVKLCKATSVHDPEIKKYKKFMDALNEMSASVLKKSCERMILSEATSMLHV